MRKTIACLLDGIEALENIDDKCFDLVEHVRWPAKRFACLKCRSSRVMKFISSGKAGKPRRLYECLDCKHQYSVLSGTLFHNSHLPLTKWLLAIYLIWNNKTISVIDLQKQIKTPYKTAWWTTNKIRKAIEDAYLTEPSGDADEHSQEFIEKFRIDQLAQVFGQVIQRHLPQHLWKPLTHTVPKI
jgi:transposase-like protein